MDVVLRCFEMVCVCVDDRNEEETADEEGADAAVEAVRLSGDCEEDNDFDEAREARNEAMVSDASEKPKSSRDRESRH